MADQEPKPPWGKREAELLALALAVALAAAPLIPGVVFVKAASGMLILLLMTRIVARNPRVLASFVRRWIDWEPDLVPSMLLLLLPMVGFVVVTTLLAFALHSGPSLWALAVAASVTAAVGAADVLLRYGWRLPNSALPWITAFFTVDLAYGAGVMMILRTYRIVGHAELTRTLPGWISVGALTAVAIRASLLTVDGHRTLSVWAFMQRFLSAKIAEAVVVDDRNWLRLRALPKLAAMGIDELVGRITDMIEVIPPLRAQDRGRDLAFLRHVSRDTSAGDDARREILMAFAMSRLPRRSLAKGLGVAC